MEKDKHGKVTEKSKSERERETKMKKDKYGKLTEKSESERERLKWRKTIWKGYPDKQSER